MWRRLFRRCSPLLSTHWNGDDSSYVVKCTLGLVAISSGLTAMSSTPTENLGIAAVVGDPDAQSFLLHALTDIMAEEQVTEAGVTTLSPSKKIVTTKIGKDQGADESRHWLPQKFDCVVVLRNNAMTAGRHDGHTAGIASVKKDSGSLNYKEEGLLLEPRDALQPQVDSTNRIAVVHEGQLSNARELRRELETRHQIVFRSNTDAELIANLIGLYVDKGHDVAEATKQTLSRLDGSWALAVLHKDKQDEVVVAQNGSRLAIGIGEGKMYVASDPEYFGPFTNSYVSLQDGEFAVVRANESTLDLSRTEQLPLVQRTTKDTALKPEPFQHWTLSEIYEQPDALYRALGCGCRIAGDMVVLGGLDKNSERMLDIKHLTLAGQGSSLYASDYGSQLMTKVGSFNSVNTVDSQEMLDKCVSKRNGGVCVVSNTGESKISQTAAKTSKKAGLPVFSVVNSVGSQVAKITKVGVYTNAGQEHGVAATKVFATQVAALGLLASWFAQYRENTSVNARLELVQALQNLPRSFSSALESRSQARIAAQRIYKARHCFVVGRGMAEPIAHEGALLLTMLSQINAEGLSPGSFRHGTLSLIESGQGTSSGTPVIIMIFSDDDPKEMRNIADQVRSSGGYTIVITDDEKLAEGISDLVITAPKNGLLTSLNAIVPLQFLAYELALLKGINPDECLSGLPVILQRGVSY